MSNCSNCKVGSPDQVKSKGGPVYNELFEELKPYRLEYDKTYYLKDNKSYLAEKFKNMLKDEFLDVSIPTLVRTIKKFLSLALLD